MVMVMLAMMMAFTGTEKSLWNLVYVPIWFSIVFSISLCTSENMIPEGEIPALKSPTRIAIRVGTPN